MLGNSILTLEVVLCNKFLYQALIRNLPCISTDILFLKVLVLMISFTSPADHVLWTKPKVLIINQTARGDEMKKSLLTVAMVGFDFVVSNVGTRRGWRSRFDFW